MNEVKSEGHHCFAEVWKNQSLPFDHELVMGNGTSFKTKAHEVQNDLHPMRN